MVSGHHSDMSDLERLLDAYLGCADAPACWKVLEADLAQFGFGSAIFGRKSNEGRAHMDRLEDAFILSSYPDEFMEYYIGQRAYMDDPMLEWGLENVGALSWGEVHGWYGQGKLSEASARLLERCAEAGVSVGYTYSLVDRQASALCIFGLCAGPGLSQAEVDRTWAGAERRITSGLHMFSLAVQRLPDAQAGGVLSKRQTEILRLVAEGKSTRDVAELLGLHRRTVEDHLSAARRAIGAETTMHALALAVRQGRV